jgi:hypothetical protein
MLFVLSKIGWLFAAPSRVLLLVALVGAAAGRRGRGVVAGALGVMAFVSVIPVGGFALARLEATFPPLIAPPHIDGVLVIGGALDAREFDAHKPPASIRRLAGCLKRRGSPRFFRKRACSTSVARRRRTGAPRRMQRRMC